MSPVNRAGSVFEISLHHSFLRKNFDVYSHEKPRWLGYRDLEFCDRDLGNRDENFPMCGTLQPGDRNIAVKLA